MTYRSIEERFEDQEKRITELEAQIERLLNLTDVNADAELAALETRYPKPPTDDEP